MNCEPLQVLYQDDRYVTIHKPAGMLVHRTAIDRDETRFCLQVLRQQLGQRVYPCHRLDKPTSGVLLFALDKEAHRAASELFSTRNIRKSYRALVRGWLEDSGTVDYPLRSLTQQGSGGAVETQEAVTRWSLSSRYEVEVSFGAFSTSRYSLVELYPQTGRMHQLRRHMKHLSHPIVGDTCYGDGRHNRFFRVHFNCHRLLLQASSLQFVQPFSSERISVSISRDPTFDRVIDQLAPAVI